MAIPLCVTFVESKLPAWALSSIKKGRQTTVEITVTPTIAGKWLELNTHNRPLKYGLIARMEQDIIRGEWKFTHQGIAFSPASVLLDGQNRLWAILNSSGRVRMLVTFNEPMSHQKYVDRGAARNPLDVLRLNGLDWIKTNKEAGIVNRISGPKLKCKIPEAVMCEIAVKLKDGILFCVRPGIRDQQLLVVLVRAYYSKGTDINRLDNFITVLQSGVTETARDVMAIKLRDLIMSKDVDNKFVFYEKCQMALHLFLAGKSKKYLKASSKELFPISIDTLTRRLSNQAARLRLKAKREVQNASS